MKKNTWKLVNFYTLTIKKQQNINKDDSITGVSKFLWQMVCQTFLVTTKSVFCLKNVLLNFIA